MMSSWYAVSTCNSWNIIRRDDVFASVIRIFDDAIKYGKVNIWAKKVMGNFLEVDVATDKM